jgi:hypothetical protein
LTGGVLLPPAANSWSFLSPHGFGFCCPELWGTPFPEILELEKIDLFPVSNLALGSFPGKYGSRRNLANNSGMGCLQKMKIGTAGIRTLNQGIMSPLL